MAYKKIVLILVFISSIGSEKTSMNLDTDHPIIIRNLADGPASLFGTSITFVKNADNDLSIIIGAPKASSSLASQKTIVEPGVLYQCFFGSERKEPCRLLVMDPTGNDRNTTDGDKSVTRERKDNGWFGGTLAKDSNKVVSCGSRWVNEFDDLKRNETHYRMNGMCFWRPTADIFQDILPDPSMESKLLPIINKDKQGGNDWGIGQAGFSIHITPNGTEMVLGAPGINVWKGSVVRYSMDPTKPFISLDDPFVIKPQMTQMLKNNSYFGFAVSSGKFFADPSSDEVQYVSGAPRGNALNGQVFIFRFPASANGPIQSMQQIDGVQAGSYFGSVLCVADVNGDGFDDLLIGAPRYSAKGRSSIDMKRLLLTTTKDFGTRGYGDEGGVFVYISTGAALRLQVKDAHLRGSREPWSRFGTSIANLGDINDDGYVDIAIGAPDDGNGVIFIYNGGYNGISNTFMQRIEASQIDSSIRGFGYTLFGGEDIDGNGYNDLAIGAYGSADVTIIRTKPLINLRGRFKSFYKKLPLNLTEPFEIESCLTYSGNYSAEKLDFKVRISVDALISVDPQRRVYIGKPEFGQFSKEVTYDEELTQGDEGCTKFLLKVVRPLESFSYDVVVRQDIEIDDSNPASTNKKTVYEIKSDGSNIYTTVSGPDYEKFCKKCPVIDRSNSIIEQLSLPLEVMCGDNEICEADLILDMSFAEISKEAPFIVGTSPNLTLVASVMNRGETAMSPFIMVEWWGNNLQLYKLPPQCNALQTHNKLKCTLGSTLEHDKSATLEFQFDVSTLKAKNYADFKIQVEAFTASDLTKRAIKSLSIPLMSKVDIFVVGTSSSTKFNPKTLTPRMSFYETFEISLIGPTSISKAVIDFYIPVNYTAKKSKANDLEIHVYEPSTEGSEFSCFAITGSFAIGRNSLTRKRSAVTNSGETLEYLQLDINETDTESFLRSLPDNVDDEVNQEKVYKSTDLVLKCESEGIQCMHVQCLMDSLSANKKAKVTFLMNVASTNLSKIFIKTSYPAIKIITKGEAKLKIVGGDEDIQGELHLPDSGVSITVIELESQAKVAGWVIGLAVVIGLMLVICLMTLLYASGCFERKKRKVEEHEDDGSVELQDIELMKQAKEQSEDENKNHHLQLNC